MSYAIETVQAFRGLDPRFSAVAGPADPFVTRYLPAGPFVVVGEVLLLFFDRWALGLDGLLARSHRGQPHELAGGLLAEGGRMPRRNGLAARHLQRLRVDRGLLFEEVRLGDLLRSERQDRCDLREHRILRDLPVVHARAQGGHLLAQPAAARVHDAERRVVAHHDEARVEVGVVDELRAVREVGDRADVILRAQRAYDIASVRFRSGLSTQLELDEAEQNLLEAQSVAAEALYLHMVARALLLHAMGEI